MTSQALPLGHLADDLAFYTDQPYWDYRPQFALDQPDTETIWITDHGRRIALINQQREIDLFEFQPGHPRLAQPTKPVRYHAPSMLGARITLVQWIDAQGRTSDTIQFQVEPSPTRVLIRIVEAWTARQIQSTKQLELRVDPRFGYVLETSDEFHSAQPIAVELYNFLVQGLTHHAPDKVRFPLVVWRTHDGRVRKWSSNMVSLRCAGQRDNAHARNLGTQGWVGFFGEPDWNPVFALIDSTAASHIGTCDNLLDEHLCFAPPATAKPGQPYRLACRGVLLSLPGPIARRVSDAALVNDLRAAEPCAWWPGPGAPRFRPFVFNQVSDFETVVPLETFFRGTYWNAIENGTEWVTVSDERAHSGRWALRMRVRPGDGEQSLAPVGSSLWLDSRRRYRLSAWVCYRGQAPARFRLRATQCYFTFAEDRARIEAVGDAPAAKDWRRLEVNLTPLADDPCLFLQLIASGNGDWFVDDVLVEELK